MGVEGRLRVVGHAAAGRATLVAAQPDRVAEDVHGARLGDAGRCREMQGGAGRCGETYRWVLSSTCLHQQGIYSNSAMATDSHRPCNMLQHFIKRQLRNRQNKLVPLL